MGGFEIKFETGVHQSDLLASLMLEGGILPSAKKHYLPKGILFRCGFRSGLMKNVYKVKEASERRTPRSLRNIWQELPTSTGRGAPLECPLSCGHAAAGPFRNHRLLRFPAPLASAKEEPRNPFLPLLKSRSPDRR